MAAQLVVRHNAASPVPRERPEGFQLPLEWRDIAHDVTSRQAWHPGSRPSPGWRRSSRMRIACPAANVETIGADVRCRMYATREGTKTRPVGV